MFYLGRGFRHKFDQKPYRILMVLAGTNYTMTENKDRVNPEIIACIPFNAAAS
jgi:hypothetical protein